MSKSKSIAALTNAYIRGQFSPEEHVREVLSALKSEKTNAIVSVREQVLPEAHQSAARYRSGKRLSALDGIPIVIKDNIAIEGQEVTAASNMLKGTISPYDATVVQKLKKAGALVVARSNMDEFAMGSSSETSAFGPVSNPHDATRVPGGSSGGSASVVAQGIVPVALGSDTGGSVRQPAAFCGIVGFKPTYGSVSRFGLVALASSYDVIGPLASSVRDAELVYLSIKGADEFDATSRNFTPSARSIKRLGVPTQGWKLAERLGRKEAQRFEQALKHLKTLGFETVDVNLPDPEIAVAIYYVINPVEASSNLARYDGVRYGHASSGHFNTLNERISRAREEGFGTEVRRRIFVGTFASSAGYQDAYYRQALNVTQVLRAQYDAVFRDVDAIVTPTTATCAFKLGAVQDPVEMYLSDIFTIPANIFGLPAISVPTDLVEGLPFGIQFIAPAGQDPKLFLVAKQFTGEE